MDGYNPAADDGGLLPPASEPATCQMCGWAPAIDVQLRRHVGMLYVMRTETVDARLCRGCGTATYRSMTNRTLVTGWWGLISFVMNFATIAQNAAAGRRLAALPPPMPAAAAAQPLPLTEPMQPGRGLLARPGPWFAGAAAAIAVFAIAAGILSTAKRSDSGAIARAGNLAVTELREGDCFIEPESHDEIEQVQAVPCEEPHTDEVIMIAELPDPPGTAFPGDQAVFESAASLCLERFDAFIGMVYEESALDVYVLSPTREGWGHGDREFACAVYEPGRRVTGSLGGAAR